MAKRETPLFVLDRSYNHKLGECDFIVCTDIDNGFIARIDYVEDAEPCATDTLRIGNENNGISLKIEVKRIFGKNPKNSQIRTLLSQADKYIQTHLHYPCNIDKPTDEECINFLDLLIRMSRVRCLINVI